MIAFVHGVPETHRYWDRLRAVVDGPSTALALPGFGCPRPDGFPATKDAYADWLVAELEAIGEPVHLVGHDWGAILSARVATTRPDLLRTWAVDVASCVHPAYEWHAFARIWQAPGEGEAFFEAQLATPTAEVAATYEAMGVPADDALVMADAADATMAGCILDLYRSAVPNPAADWGRDLGPTGAPGLVVHATADPFADEIQLREVAAMLGAPVAELEGCGHFWAVEDPTAAAGVLEGLWADVG